MVHSADGRHVLCTVSYPGRKITIKAGKRNYAVCMYCTHFVRTVNLLTVTVGSR